MSKAHEFLLQIVKTHPDDYEDFGEKENGNGDCSSGCRWYLPLEGRLGGDWGVCANPSSHRVGLLTFEHQGCEQYEYDPDEDVVDWGDEDPAETLERSMDRTQHAEILPLVERANEEVRKWQEYLNRPREENDDAEG